MSPRQSYNAEPLLSYLDNRGIEYEIEYHAHSETALWTAEEAHVSGKRFAKTVVLKDEFGDFILAVLPAHLDVHIAKLARLSGSETLHLAAEEEFAEIFPDSEIGAMPPFGNLYDVEVFIDDDLAVVPDVTFNACSHRHTITLRVKDFLAACEGVVGDFSQAMKEPTDS